MRRAMVYKSEGFKKTLTLCQDNTLVTTESDRGFVHIDGNGNTLRIYVPRDLRSCRKCYSTDLPKALVRWLEIEDTAATATFGLVCCVQDDAIEYMLDNNGIITTADTDADETNSSIAENESGSMDTDAETVDLRPLNREGSTPFEINFQSMTTTPYTTRHSSQHPEDAYRQVPFRSAPQFSEPSGAPSVSLPDDPRYLLLLEHVITIARHGSFPQTSLAEVNRLSSGSISGGGLASGIRSDSQLMHDIKIGAAGELYVGDPLNSSVRYTFLSGRLLLLFFFPYNLTNVC